jgi:hypothetical protein
VQPGLVVQFTGTVDIIRWNILQEVVRFHVQMINSWLSSVLLHIVLFIDPGVVCD